MRKNIGMYYDTVYLSYLIIQVCFVFKTSLVGLSRVNRQLGAWPLHLGAQRHGPCARASLAGAVGISPWKYGGNDIYWGYINQRDII